MKTKIQLMIAKQEQETRRIRADYAHKTEVQAITILALQKAGALPTPLVLFELANPEDIDFLLRYKKVYGCVDILRCGIAAFDGEVRNELKKNKAYSTVDKWAIDQYFEFYKYNQLPTDSQKLQEFNKNVSDITKLITAQFVAMGTEITDPNFRIVLDRLRRIAKKRAERTKGMGGTAL